MTSTLAFLVLVLTAGPGPRVEPVRVPTPRDAVSHAANDLASVPPHDQKFQRYLWFPEPTPQRIGLAAYVLNQSVGHADSYRPVVLHRGALLRIDLRGLAPREKDFLRLRDLWEEMAAGNFYFHTIRNVITEFKQDPILVPSDPWRHENGRVYRQRWETPPPIRKEVLTSEFALHTNLEKALLLHVLTGESKNPIMLGEQFILQATTTTRHTNFDGLYYRFRGMEPVPGRMDIDVWLERFGSSWDQVLNLDSDSRAGMTRSRVTNKARRIDFFYGTNVRPSRGAPLITLTHDIARGNNDVTMNPIRSLLADRWDAIEAIAILPNGLQEFAIFDADGRLADSVPDTIAHDNTIPGIAEKILEPGVSCIICHNKQDGYLDFRNNVKELMQAGFIPIDDETSKKDPLETLEQLRAKYGGNLDFRIKDTRNDLARAVYLITGGMSVKEVGDELQKVRDDYFYTPMTPQRVLKSLGVVVESEQQATELLNEICPLPPANRYGIRMEDPILALLRINSPNAPQEINRIDWEPIFSDVMLRVTTKRALDRGLIPNTGGNR
jgi:hypothetical protein